MQNAGTRDLVRNYYHLDRCNRCPICSISHLPGGKSPYKAAVSGFAVFAATVLLAIVVEQALGVLN